METTLSQSGAVWNSDLGEFIDSRHAHLAEILHDYKPSLFLVYIPKKDRDATDTKPWAILDKPEGMQEHIVRYLSDAEMENPTAILQWVFEGDLTKHSADDIFNRIEAGRRADELMQTLKKRDEIDEALELIEFAAKTNKHTWKHDGKVYHS